jgi:hypothetical protein
VLLMHACSGPEPGALCPLPISSRRLPAAAFLILFIEFLGYFLLAVYLDHVLADENGALTWGAGGACCAVLAAVLAAGFRPGTALNSNSNGSCTAASTSLA